MSHTANTILRDLFTDVEIAHSAIKIASTKQLLADIADAIDAAYVAETLQLTPDDWGKITSAVMLRGDQIDKASSMPTQKDAAKDDLKFTKDGNVIKGLPTAFTMQRDLVPHYMRIPQQMAQIYSTRTQLLQLLAFARRLGLHDAAEHIQLTTDQ